MVVVDLLERYKSDPKQKLLMIQNVTLALNFLESNEGFKLVSIGAEGKKEKEIEKNRRRI